MYAKIFFKFFNKFLDKLKLGGGESEKDRTKISIVCVAGLIPFLLNFLPGWLSGTQIYEQNEWLQMALLPLPIVSNILCQCAEELCLLAICPEFRSMLVPSCCEDTVDECEITRYKTKTARTMTVSTISSIGNVGQFKKKMDASQSMTSIS